MRKPSIALPPSPHRRSFTLGLSSLALISQWPMAAHAATNDEARRLLEGSDRVRNLPGSFSVRNALIEFRQGRQTSSSVLMVYARPAPDSGQYNNLVKFVSPARDAGKLMLRNGLDLWFYDPSTRASVRISPQQRLLGQASNGDVMSTNLAQDYSADIMGHEEVRDGDGQTRRAARLRLQALRSDVAYALAEYWIEPDSFRPVMAKYFTAEGRLLKTAYFRKYEAVLGVQRPTETVIIDGLDPDWVTVMQLSQHSVRDVPATWLQREYLPRFTGQ